jgi:Siphovirus Gp157
VNRLGLAAVQYQVIRDRLRALEPELDEQTLADTVEGLTDLYEILAAVAREALSDEAMALGLQHRIDAMGKRLDRLTYRAAQRREIVRDVMVESEIKQVAAPDLTLSVRPGNPSVTVIDEAAIPEDFFETQKPRLNRQKLLGALKLGADVQGAQLSNPAPVLTVRTK